MIRSSSHILRNFVLGNVSRPIHTKRLFQVIRNMASKCDAPKVVVVDGQEFTEIQEGLALILIPASAKNGDCEKDAKNEEERQKVFYNPIQQFNRDLTVLAIKAYGEQVAVERRAATEIKLNNKKRKRSLANDGNEQKHQKSDHSNANEDVGQVASVTEDKEAAPGDPMDISEPQNVEQTSTKIDTPDVEPKEENQASKTDQPTDEGLDVKDKPNESFRPRKQDPPRFTILDALSATGLRALRYAQELPFVTSVTANDLMPSAVESIKRNAVHNGVESKINATQGDALAHMYVLMAGEVEREHLMNPRDPRRKTAPPSKKYDVIDLDPYGTAATFFEAAVQSVRDDGGLLCVTCTDSGVWASHGYSEKAFALYGGVPIKGIYSHEAGIRLILNGIATTAARHGLAIEPLLSLSIDYYVRIFVRVRKSPASVKFLAGKSMIVYNCDQGCGAWETQLLLRNKKHNNSKGTGMFYKHGLSMAPTTDKHCEHCGSKAHLAGPMYAGPLHSQEFIKRILDDLPNAPKEIYGTTARIEGMLNTALEEFLTPPADDSLAIKEDELAAVDPYPFYFIPTHLAGTIHCMCPDEDSLRGALCGLGYEVTRSHCKPGSIKTSAPWSVIWHVMREWVRQNSPVREDKIKPGSAAYRLLRLDKKKSSEENGDGSKDGGKEEEKGNAVDKLEVVFNKSLGQDKSKKGLVRYQMNPKENWGPLSKASGH